MEANVPDRGPEQSMQPASGRDGAPFPVGLALVAFALALGLYSFLNSPYFHVAAVTVEGNRAVSAAEVRDLASVYPGDKLLQVDLRKLAARVASHPRVRHVHVDRRLPDTLLIVVQEHVPVAWVVPLDGPEAAVDAEADESPPSDTEGEEQGPVRAAVNEAGQVIPLVGDEGDRLPVAASSRPELLPAAVAAAAAMPEGLRAVLLRIDAEDGGEGVHITAHTRSGGVILFGSEEDMPRKAAIAASLLEGDDYALVDVRFPRSPAVRPR